METCPPLFTCALNSTTAAENRVRVSRSGCLVLGASGLPVDSAANTPNSEWCSYTRRILFIFVLIIYISAESSWKLWCFRFYCVSMHIGVGVLLRGTVFISENHKVMFLHFFLQQSSLYCLCLQKSILNIKNMKRKLTILEKLMQGFFRQFHKYLTFKIKFLE